MRRVDLRQHDGRQIGRRCRDVIGTWKGTLDTQIGTVEVTIVIDGASPLSGQATLGEFGGKIEEGKLDGDKLSFVVKLEHGTITFDGTVANDEMKLTVVGTGHNGLLREVARLLQHVRGAMDQLPAAWAGRSGDSPEASSLNY